MSQHPEAGPAQPGGKGGEHIDHGSTVTRAAGTSPWSSTGHDQSLLLEPPVDAEGLLDDVAVLAVELLVAAELPVEDPVSLLLCFPRESLR